MKLYLAGPMKGLPDWNYPAFERAATRLRGYGHEVTSPHEKDAELGHDPNTDGHLGYRFYMSHDLPLVLAADAVAVLSGWRKSKGARIEVHVAQECGIPILDVETLEPITETACQEAHRLVFGDRGETYGHPREDFARTGKMWAAVLGVESVTPSQVALCMMALKISRHTYQPKHDNIVDMAGYAECLYRIEEA